MEDQIIKILEIIVIVGIILAPTTAWLRSKFKCLDKVSKRSFRQSKALIILANRWDDINEAQHGKDHHLGDEVEEILKDEKGNL